jgi:hypothetical protein
MRSVKAAGTAFSVLIAGAALAAAITTQALDTFARTGQLDLLERVSLAAANWYVRALPFLALAVVGITAVLAGVGAAQPSVIALRQERYGWVAFGLVTVITGVAILELRLGPWWGLALSVAAASSLVALSGVVIASVRISRRQRSEPA